MVIRWPHRVVFTLIESIPVQDENGDWIPNNTEATIETPCRAEPNGSGKLVITEDGSDLVYSWLVFTKVIDRLPFGTPVKVYDGNELFVTGTIKKFSKDQKHCRIWL